MISQLKRVASKSPHPKNQHATLVFKGGALVAQGFNHDGIHAEVVALRKLWPSKRRGTVVVNYMIRTRSGVPGNSRACEECLEFLRKNEVEKMIYFDGTTFVDERL